MWYFKIRDNYRERYSGSRERSTEEVGRWLPAEELAEGSRRVAVEEGSWRLLGRFRTREPKEEEEEEEDDGADDHCWTYLSSCRLRLRPCLILFWMCFCFWETVATFVVLIWDLAWELRLGRGIQIGTVGRVNKSKTFLYLLC